MKEWEGFGLKIETPLRYRDGFYNYVGVLSYNENEHQHVFLNRTPNAKMIQWNITNWSWYEAMTEGEFCLFILENL